MAIKNINYSVRLYKLVPATVLQAYQHRIAQTLFGLPKAETKYGQLQVNADGTWRFENLLAKGSNTFNPNNAQTKEKALEFATNWLSQVRSKISEALEKQIFPTDLQNLIPHNYLRLESATPQYKENSQYITHWDIRYDLEYPYYPNLKARGDQQHFTLQVSDRIIGVEAQCRATNGVEGSTLITPAPLQDMEAILQAQIPVITIDENADADELPPLQALPIVYRIVRNRLLPYWITQSGDLVPATREGEGIEQITATSAYIYDWKGVHIYTKKNAKFAIYVFDPYVLDNIEKKGGNDYIEELSEKDLQKLSSFYLSERSIGQGAMLAKQQDDRAKAILFDKEGTIVEKLDKIFIGENKISELLLMFYITKDSNEAMVYDATFFVDWGRRGHYWIDMKDYEAEDIDNEFERMGYIAIAHGHTHGQYYSLFDKHYASGGIGYPSDSNVQSFIDTLDAKDAVYVATPSPDDRTVPHFFYQLYENSVSRRPRIQFIFTNKGFTVYTGGHYIYNMGEFFFYGSDKKHKTS